MLDVGIRRKYPAERVHRWVLKGQYFAAKGFSLLWTLRIPSISPWCSYFGLGPVGGFDLNTMHVILG